MDHIDSQFNIIKEAPGRLYDDSEKWLTEAKGLLDTFTENLESANYIAFHMLECKQSKPDIISSGEKIVMQLDGIKDVSAAKIERQID